MNIIVTDNYAKVQPSLLYLPSLILVAVALFLYMNDSLNDNGYAEIQKGVFFLLNSHLSQLPMLQHNLTQLGNSMIFMSFLAVFFVAAPKMWESLLSASIISGIFSKVLKMFFSVPRPAQYFDNDSFSIIGEKLMGYASCPSGHSITIFTTLTVLMFAFMPKTVRYKTVWVLSVFIVGAVIALSRVGVGAHHPLDVLIGSTIGYISGLIGIFVSRRYPVIWRWIGNIKFYPVFVLLFVGFAVAIILKITKENLIVFDLALLSLAVSIYFIIKAYVRQIKEVDK